MIQLYHGTFIEIGGFCILPGTFDDFINDANLKWHFFIFSNLIIIIIFI